MQNLVKTAHEAKKRGFNINIKTTQVTKTKEKRNTSGKIEVKNFEFEEVDSFRYLGTAVNGRIKEE